MQNITMCNKCAQLSLTLHVMTYHCPVVTRDHATVAGRRCRELLFGHNIRYGVTTCYDFCGHSGHSCHNICGHWSLQEVGTVSQHGTTLILWSLVTRGWRRQIPPAVSHNIRYGVTTCHNICGHWSLGGGGMMPPALSHNIR